MGVMTRRWTRDRAIAMAFWKVEDGRANRRDAVLHGALSSINDIGDCRGEQDVMG